MVPDRRDPVRPTFPNDQTEETAPRGQGANRRSLAGFEAGGDEALHPTGCVGDPERSVSCVDELADLVDDELKHVVDREDAGNGARRRIECGECRRVG